MSPLASNLFLMYFNVFTDHELFFFIKERLCTTFKFGTRFSEYCLALSCVNQSCSLLKSRCPMRVEEKSRVSIIIVVKLNLHELTVGGKYLIELTETFLIILFGELSI